MAENGATTQPISYVKKAFSKTLVTGVSQIIKADGILDKLYRCSTLILCSVLLCYILVQHLVLYTKYNAISDLSVQRDLVSADLPAFTICMPERKQTSAEFCSEVCQFGVGFNNSVKGQFFGCNDNSMVTTNTLNSPSIPPVKSILHSCVVIGLFPRKFEKRKRCSTSDVRAYRLKSPWGITNICYTFNSLISQPKQEPQQVSTLTYIRLRVKPLHGNDDNATLKPAIQISIHSPYTLLNPYLHGFRLHIGINSEMLLQKEVTTRLPSPYSTSCHDYIDTWRRNKGFGSTNRKECLQECFAKIALERQGCIPNFIDWPHEHRPCLKETKDPELAKLALECYAKNCKPPCHDHSYKVFAQVTNVNDEDNCEKMDRFRTLLDCRNLSSDLFGARIRLNRMLTTVVSLKPAHDEVLLYSYIGGFLALCCGFSVLQALDLLNIIMDVMYYKLSETMIKKHKR